MLTSDMSMEQQVALMSPEERDMILDGLDLDELLYDWSWNGRPSQILPTMPEDGGDDWNIALALAGRGFGKTLMGAQWIRDMDTRWKYMGQDTAHLRVALLGRTAADVRDTMLEGPSGLLNVYPPSVRDRVVWTPSRRRVELPNGGVCLAFSSEEPAQLRGPQFHRAWCVAEGTMVRTVGGQLPIESIDVGDRVWTRDGLRPVMAAGLTGIKPVMTLETTSGRVLRASAEHRLWTSTGWQSMRNVAPGAIIYAWTNSMTTQCPDLQHGLSGTESSGTETRKMATTETPVEGFFYTSPYGSQPTAAYPMDSRSTTGITIAATMPNQTLLVGPSRTTAPTTRRNGLSTIQHGSSRPCPRPDRREPRNYGQPGSLDRSPAETAELSFSQSGCGRSTAAPLVLQPLVVKSVESNWEPVRTYDLTVAGAPEYFADDILVHNCDELATFRQVRSPEDDATAWENLRIAVRLGKRPQILATTTPKRVPVMRQLMAEAAAHPEKFLLRRGKTYDNRYLSSAYLDVLVSLYGGTSLGRQELEGEMLEDILGATTSEAIIERNRVTEIPSNIPWIRLVSVDPSVAERPNDECGILVVYISKTWPTLHRHAIVVDDLSVRASPSVWGDIVVKAAHEHQATIVAETNQGANLVFQMLRQSADAAGLAMPPMKEVWSSKAKAVRAEPVGGAYSRNRVHHLNVLAEYENQLTSWVTGDGYSPDRLDAGVQGLAAGLFPEALTGGGLNTATLHNVAKEHIPMTRQTAMARRGGGWR